MYQLKNLIKKLDEALVSEEEFLKTWIMFNLWFDEKLDEYRFIVEKSSIFLENYTKTLIEETNILSLKIKYNKIIWYFIEIPLSQKQKVPDYFEYKNTLVNAIRYTTKELKDFEEKILSWEILLKQREKEIFDKLLDSIIVNYDFLKDISIWIWELDFFCSLSKVALENNYTKPEINNNYDLEITWWRHPILEKIEKNFISNDLYMNEKSFIHIITWPNMWWKSTYLRQNALIVYMAHLGSFVPAKKSNIPICDKIFSRIWASDNLFKWASTFMVEMQEMANILNNATDRSFVIIDEVWRWTSTYDWMSLAYSIVKYLHDTIKSKTLFATHYHELIDEWRKMKWVKNMSVAVSENEDNIVFLRKIIPWGIKKSYWIEVASLAWIKKEIIDIAMNFLKNMEQKTSFFQLSLWIIWDEIKEKTIQKESEIENELKNLDINNLTPLEALNKLYELKSKIK